MRFWIAHLSRYLHILRITHKYGARLRETATVIVPLLHPLVWIPLAKALNGTITKADYARAIARYCRNAPHHWRFWVMGTTALEMPEEWRNAMLVTWIAERGTPQKAMDFFKEAVDAGVIMLAPETKKKVFKALEGYIEHTPCSK